MSSVDRLVKLAEHFSRKLSLAQTVSAQPGDIEKALRSAGLWEKTAEVSPLLNKAGVADDASVSISIMVDNKLEVNYLVNTSPPAAAIKLRGLLKAKYGAAMKAAISAAHLQVADTLTLPWMTF